MGTEVYTLSLKARTREEFERFTPDADWVCVPRLRLIEIPARSAEELVGALKRLRRAGVELQQEGYGHRIQMIGAAARAVEGRLYTPRCAWPTMSEARVPPDTAWYQVGTWHYVHPEIVGIFQSLFGPASGCGRSPSLQPRAAAGARGRLHPRCWTTRLTRDGTLPLVARPALLEGDVLEGPLWVLMNGGALVQGVVLPSDEAATVELALERNDSLVIGSFGPVVCAGTEVGREIIAILDALAAFGGLWPIHNGAGE